MVDEKTAKEIMDMKSNSNAIVISTSQLGPSLVPELIMGCNNADYWHKFVIKNVESYERDFILRTIMEFVDPANLIPFNFVKKKEAFFLACNCLDALLKLAQSKLIIPNPLNPALPLKVVVIANHLPIHQLKFDCEENVIAVLRKRYNPVANKLNLMEFHNDPDLKVFFPLSQAKLMQYVMQFAAELNPKIIDLRKNFLKVLNPIRLLAGYQITNIDLGNNEIAQIQDLEPLTDLQELKLIKLNKNPICNDPQAWNYIHKIKRMFPNIRCIDGVYLNRLNEKFRDVRRNFLCSDAGGDLTSQFIEHFFTVYDSEDRQNIAPLYHKDAMFSVTSRVIPNQKSSLDVQLAHYQSIDRNLKGSHGSSQQFLFTGREAIMKLFASLPRSDHEPNCFKCDLVYFTETVAVLVINGVFRENKRYISFSRTFVLKHEDDDSYSIINEQLHVFNMLNVQRKSTDAYPKHVEFSGRPLPYYNSQYVELQMAVHKITKLNYDYSQRFLVACNYDLKSTLELFIDMHLKSEIPSKAFFQVMNEGLLNLKEKGRPFEYPRIIEQQCLKKHPVISPQTIWQTVKDNRVAAEYIQKEATQEIQILEIEKRKQSILMPTPNEPSIKSRTKTSTATAVETATRNLLPASTAAAVETATGNLLSPAAVTAVKIATGDINAGSRLTPTAARAVNAAIGNIFSGKSLKNQRRNAKRRLRKMQIFGVTPSLTSIPQTSDVIDLTDTQNEPRPALKKNTTKASLQKGPVPQPRQQAANGGIEGLTAAKANSIKSKKWNRMMALNAIQSRKDTKRRQSFL